MSIRAETIERLRLCIGDLKHAQDLALFESPLEAEAQERVANVCDDTIDAIRLVLFEWHQLQSKEVSDETR